MISFRLLGIYPCTSSKPPLNLQDGDSHHQVPPSEWNAAHVSSLSLSPLLFCTRICGRNVKSYIVGCVLCPRCKCWNVTLLLLYSYLQDSARPAPGPGVVCLPCASRKVARGGSAHAVSGAGSRGIANRPLCVEWFICKGRLYDIT